MTTTQSGDAPRQPIASRQFDRVQAAIWRRVAPEGAAPGPEYTVSFSRSFKDAEGRWQRTHSLTSRDLPHLQLAVEWAMRELLLKAE